MGSSFSLFTDVGPIPPQYQVFINFRGEKLRDGFLGFLVDALLKENVNVFIDDHELRGRDLDHLFSRIEESRVALTIFSKNFTESRWCLDELAKIRECVDQGSLTVIPIFFKMKTDDVKKLKGKFGDNFRDLKSTHRGEPENFRRWKEALIFVSKKAGLSSSRYSRQNDLVSTIVEEVKKVLNDIAEMERQIVEVKRNNLAARTDELIRFVVRFLSLFLLFTIVFGPYVLGLLTFFSFLVGRLIINRAVESEW
ncbi:protein PHLOEM PROTEIN 2-LIKE A8 [Arabidopsis lyrata subsp. lyrata]|uniref:protein PHLOEM PROTEIN 2-LIKE A8 n=1 Tax=Arabidopsis lyrata subsp. lyrata TaxID=81972 RepID=UPI000A29C9BE|nr:protein PHLOEM PROTEIN 2-LIKE A8 [Arabidopsis lyrata subsp. lyrata]|eukprot:XP_020884560.1 protein PHLOEM PROTEIN 2-LIKE A8 [Arabidopsis lyrata subsp. lyrata]